MAGYYYVDEQDWPGGVESSTAGMSPEKLLSTLNELDEYVEPAMRSLAVTAKEGLSAEAEKQALTDDEPRA